MASKNETTRASKFLSLVLRHEPGTAGITLDSAGWVAVDDLLRGCAAHGHAISRELLDDIVRTSDKQRFAFNEDRTRIRANQGHSVEVELEHAQAEPPQMLYHGTAERNLASILQQGLHKAQRHHVHLSPTPQIAHQVGQRHGKPVILRVDARQMHADGFTFYLTPNNVWLVDNVPAKYLSRDDESAK
jgi:putative RNA 2'-phosphotransferase